MCSSLQHKYLMARLFAPLVATSGGMCSECFVYHLVLQPLDRFVSEGHQSEPREFLSSSPSIVQWLYFQVIYGILLNIYVQLKPFASNERTSDIQGEKSVKCFKLVFLHVINEPCLVPVCLTGTIFMLTCAAIM